MSEETKTTAPDTEPQAEPETAAAETAAAEPATEAEEASAKEGAVLIMCAELADGTGGEGFYTSLRDCESPRAHFERCAATPQNQTIPDQWEGQILCRILMKHRVSFVSRPEMETTLREMKLDYAPTLEAALAMAKADKGENASITVIPNGISVIVKEK